MLQTQKSEVKVKVKLGYSIVRSKA